MKRTACALFLLFLGLTGLMPPAAQAADGGLRLGRGISLHEVMNWPEMNPGATPSYRWPAFQSERYRLRTEVLQKLKAAGFDTIRLTVGLGIFLSADDRQRQELDAILLQRVKAIIDAGFTTIVDLHPIGQDQRFPALAFTRSPGEPLVEAYRAFLVRTATNLSKLPRDRVALELMNEPETRNWSQEEVRLWNRVQKSYFDTVRARAPELTLIVTGCCANSGEELDAIDGADYPGPDVIFTFHFYEPHAFTHQGVVQPSNPAGVLRFFKEVPFPLGPDQLAQTQSKAQSLLSSETVSNPVQFLQLRRGVERETGRLEQFATADAIDAAFRKLLASARAHRIPEDRLFLGEFGVMRPGVSNASRGHWLRAVRSAAERHRIPWSYWSFEAPDYMGLATADGTFDSVILDALGMRRTK